jgi:hypothetical protein
MVAIGGVRWDDGGIIQWLTLFDARQRLAQLAPALANRIIRIVRNGRAWDGTPPIQNVTFQIQEQGW